MKTEQDIKKFMQENRIPVPTDGAFMEDLIRQIDSLPVPASLDGTDDKVEENIRMVKAILEVQKKRSRRQAAAVALVTMIISMAIFTAGFLFVTPNMQNSILMSMICLGVLAISISRTDLVQMMKN